ncbi:MAG: hypothetical protein M3418_10535 [Gemmatimonadota bacterium]|nr:hypothetical protein [Gemmatimonadota bacterium]
MKIWMDGERSRAICPSCERKTEVVYQRREVTLSAPPVTAEDVLVAVCVECEGIAMVPHQSTPKLREAIQKPKETLNVRVPGHLEDVLYLLVDRVAHGWKNGKAPVLKYLLHEFGDNPEYARRVREHLDDDLAQGPADQDVSVRVPTYILVAVDQMAEMVGIANRSEVVRGVLASAKEDVLEERDPEFASSIQRAIAAVA